MKVQIINPYESIGELHNQCVEKVLENFHKKTEQTEVSPPEYDNFTTNDMCEQIVECITLTKMAAKPIELKISIDVVAPNAKAKTQEININFGHLQAAISKATMNDFLNKDELQIKTQVANSINNHILHQASFDLEKLPIDDKIKFFCQKLLSIDYDDQDKVTVKAKIQDVVSDIIKINVPEAEKQVALVGAAVAEKSHESMYEAKKNADNNGVNIWRRIRDKVEKFTTSKMGKSIKKTVVEDTKGAFGGGFTKYLEGTGTLHDMITTALIGSVVTSSTIIIEEVVNHYENHKKP